MMEQLYLALSRIQNKQRPLIVLIVCILTSGGWYWLGMRSIEEKILSEQEQLATLKRKLLMRPKTLERISNLEANIEAQRERKLKLGDQLPTKEDIARLIDQLYEKATRSNLKITRFERGDRTDEELFTRIEIEMEFYATFQNVLHFFAELHDVKTLERIVNIEELKLARVDKSKLKTVGEESQEALSGSCLLVTFMSKSKDQESK